MTTILVILKSLVPDALAAELERLASKNDLDAMLTLTQSAGGLSALGLRGEMDIETMRRYLAVGLALMKALPTYSVSALSVPVHLFTAVEERGRPDPTLGWRDVIGDHLRVTVTGGTHMTMMEAPHIEHLGRALSCSLHAVASGEKGGFGFSNKPNETFEGDRATSENS